MDILIFGRRASRHMAQYIRQTDLAMVGANPHPPVEDEIKRWLGREHGDSVAPIRDATQTS